LEIGAGSIPGSLVMDPPGMDHDGCIEAPHN
jgi:hypothetical protein